MIILEKFGGGQAERKGNAPVSSDRPVVSATLLALPVPTKERTKEVSPSQTGKRLSRSTVAALSAVSTRGGTSVSLHGTRFANHGPRLAVSNRELWTVHYAAAPSRLVRDRTVVLRHRSRVADHGPRLTPDRTVILRHGSRGAGRGSRPPAPFLTGTGSQTEIAVTHSKQTTATFLTETRIAHFGERPSEKRRAQAVHATTFENPMLPRPGVRLWTQSAARYNAYTNHNEIISFRSEL
jgi:hypothetical protein